MKLSEIKFVDGERVVVDARITDDELRARFPAQCESGRVFIFAAAPNESERGYISLYLAQCRPVTSGNDLDADPNGLGPMHPELVRALKWEQYPTRHRQSVHPDSVQHLEIGDEFVLISKDGDPVRFDIQQSETLDATKDRYMAINPRQRKVRDIPMVVVNKSGKPIYRRTSLVDMGAENLDILFDYRVSKIPVSAHVEAMEQLFDELEAEAAEMAAEAAVR